MNWISYAVGDSTKGDVSKVTKDETTALFPFPCSDTTDCTHYVVDVAAGEYTLEVWGSQGGNGTSYPTTIFGGRGGYSRGTIKLFSKTTLYIYVGGSGTGDKDGSMYGSSGGGGATDIRVQGGEWNNSESLKKRIIVAGGGGGRHGNFGDNDFLGNDGGGETAPTFAARGYTTEGASQTSGGGSNYYDEKYPNTIVVGSFGYANPNSESNSKSKGGFNGGSRGSDNWANGGAGGGWWGGCTSWPTGSGGSGFVYTSTNPQCSAPSIYILTDAKTFSGNTEFDSPYGGREIGHRGNGFARITIRIEYQPQSKDFFRSCYHCSFFFVDRRRRFFISMISVFIFSLLESETPNGWSVPELVMV